MTIFFTRLLSIAGLSPPMTVRFFSTHKPSPDWKGGVAVAARQWRGLGPPEPWKAGKNCFLAIFTRQFSSKTDQFYLQTGNAPRLKLRCVNPWRCLFAKGKNCKDLAGHVVAGHSLTKKVAPDKNSEEDLAFYQFCNQFGEQGHQLFFAGNYVL